MEKIKYVFRPARIDFERESDSDTVVVFMHGIYSETRTAFKLDGQKGFFWDLLKESSIFSTLDFAIFSYGRIDFSYILEWDNPFNNLQKISQELHGYLSTYKNVIFVAHSQGGLLAKTYATLFCKMQGIFLITLHTPHRNKSFTVMRSTRDVEWIGKTRYVVPHIFSASINDNKIVKPDNALWSGVDVKYVSKDKKKFNLGHSHLSRSPDQKLINLIEKNIFLFMHSGLTKRYVNNAQRTTGSHYRQNRLKILFSRSPRRLKEAITETSNVEYINKPWEHPFFSAPETESQTDSKSSSEDLTRLIIATPGCSAEYLVRRIASQLSPTNECIGVVDLDNKNEGSRRSANDYICEISFQASKNMENPYRDTAFDVCDINKKELIDDKEFLDVLNQLIQKKGISIKQSEKLEPSIHKELVRDAYAEAKMEYRTLVINSIYRDFPSGSSIGVNALEETVSVIVIEIKKLKPFKKEYVQIYEIIKRSTVDSQQVFGIFEIEYLISRLLRTDGSVFWLDKHISYLF